MYKTSSSKMTGTPRFSIDETKAKQTQESKASSNSSISLLSLPHELHRQIITNLTDHQTALFCLRRVNTYFWSIISPDEIRKYTRSTQATLKEIERHFASLIVEGHLPCSFCLCILPTDQFYGWRQRTGLTGDNRRYRSCISCVKFKSELRAKARYPVLRSTAQNVVDFLMSRNKGKLVLRPGWRSNGGTIRPTKSNRLASISDMRPEYQAWKNAVFRRMPERWRKDRGLAAGI